MLTGDISEQLIVRDQEILGGTSVFAGTRVLDRRRMRIRLDEYMPRQLRRDLVGHDVRTVVSMGWAGIKNGALLRLAESSFDVFVTIDQNIPYQQTLRGISIAIIILSAVDNRMETLQPIMSDVLTALEHIRPGEIVHIAAAK